ncbi:GWxTD domain-containing protein [Salibacter halophilus]|uniref:GWxTD domain-containing protein n=1 Tax=Salibacter halophilus TaxID=1803916 RepID=A0A6N6MAL0_9FLAO|nr:GWxTD domain-containing protein [Salibacter halophilus]KAB1064286.1 GWxTD domain-containing protein [Salibacter halophilus]
MKSTITAFLLIISSTVFGQSLTGLDAQFALSTFSTPTQEPYVENYLKIQAKTINYKKNSDSLYQGKLIVTYTFSQGDTVRAFKKFEILSPTVTSPDSAKGSFMDLQRIAIDNGVYDLEIKLRDAYGSDHEYKGSQTVNVNYPENELSISDIELIANKSVAKNQESPFVKNGLKFIPYVYDYYPTEINTLSFYAEVYNASQSLGEETPYVIRYGIVNDYGDHLPQFTAYQRERASDIAILAKDFDISQLPTGNFKLKIDLLDSAQKVLRSEELEFLNVNKALPQQNAPTNKYDALAEMLKKTPQPQLLEHIYSMKPIASVPEKSFIRIHAENVDKAKLENFFIDFWMEKNPRDPYQAWKEYRKKVEYVNQHFGTRVEKGYETDRGLTYLKYGQPNTIVRRDNEPSNYPYHIWHYYKHPKRSDARYVFYNKDKSTNDYKLLHSNVIGEINNPRWKYELQRRNTPYGDVDFEGDASDWGNQSDDFFNQPR